MSGYVTVNNIRPKKNGAVRGSGGISVFVRENLISEKVVKRIYNRFNECVVLLLDGSKFENLNDLAIFFTYVAPQNSSFYSTPDENGIEMLANKIVEVTSEYRNAEVLIAGDLNARIKDFLDFIPDDNIDHVCAENNMYPGDFFCIPRKSKDLNTYNAYGCSLVKFCCGFDVHIMNGRFSGDIEGGDFTC